MLKKKLIDKKNREEAFKFPLSKNGKYTYKHNYKENVFQKQSHWIKLDFQTKIIDFLFIKLFLQLKSEASV